MSEIEEAVKELVQLDPRLAAVVEEHGYPDFVQETDYYRALVRAIVYQQLSGKVASVIFGRFQGLFGDEFPTPEEVLERDHETLRGVGLSNAKAKYIRDLSSWCSRDGLSFDDYAGMEDEEIVADLVQVKGIGRWTAEMFLMFTLGRPDVVSTGDLGLRKGFQILNKLDEQPKPAEMEKGAEIWRPYRTYACWYLWRIVEGPFDW